jgi:penicillin-binding protein 1A
VVGPQQEARIHWEGFRERWPAYLPPDRAEARTQPQPLAIRALADVFSVGDHIQGEIVSQEPQSGHLVLDLYQEPQANGAVYMMDPKTGEALAMVGGIRFGRSEGGSEFIRATQAERQPGSSFKPIIYAAAIEEGYTPATILDDSPRVFTMASGRKHTPQNYDQSYLGRMSLREALVRSRNVPTVQLVEEIGARKVIEYARKFGLSGAIPEESIIALGTHSVRLSELTRAYAAFPNGGQLVEPIYVLRVEDSRGNVLLSAEPRSRQVISESTAYMVADMMRDVVRNPFGTGYNAMQGFSRPSGGKTGTTQNYSDAWYLGFIPQLAAGVYVGFDDPTTSLGPYESGGRAAAPIWKNLMQRVEGSLPIETFRQPETVVTMRVGPGGQMLSPCDNLDQARFELFRAEIVPRRMRDSTSCLSGPLQAAPPPPAVQPGPRPTRREDVDL